MMIMMQGLPLQFRRLHPSRLAKIQETSPRSSISPFNGRLSGSMTKAAITCFTQVRLFVFPMDIIEGFVWWYSAFKYKLDRFSEFVSFERIANW